MKVENTKFHLEEQLVDECKDLLTNVSLQDSFDDEWNIIKIMIAFTR